MEGLEPLPGFSRVMTSVNIAAEGGGSSISMSKLELVKICKMISAYLTSVLASFASQ